MSISKKLAKMSREEAIVFLINKIETMSPSDRRSHYEYLLAQLLEPKATPPPTMDGFK
jgi:hypothetical protein